MKKLSFLLFILPMYIYSASFNELEEAILDVNAEKVGEILKDMEPLTDSQKMAYIELARQVYQEKYDEKIVRTIRPHMNELQFIGILGSTLSLSFVAICLIVDCRCKEIGILPIVTSCVTFFISCLIGKKGNLKAQNSERHFHEKYLNSIKIKQLLYSVRP